MRRNAFVFALVSALFVGVILSASSVLAAEKVIRWKMTSTWPPSIDLIQADQAFVKAVNQLCKGRLESNSSPEEP